MNQIMNDFHPFSNIFCQFFGISIYRTFWNFFFFFQSRRVFSRKCFPDFSRKFGIFIEKLCSEFVEVNFDFDSHTETIKIGKMRFTLRAVRKKLIFWPVFET